MCCSLISVVGRDIIGNVWECRGMNCRVEKWGVFWVGKSRPA